MAEKQEAGEKRPRPEADPAVTAAKRAWREYTGLPPGTPVYGKTWETFTTVDPAVTPTKGSAQRSPMPPPPRPLQMTPQSPQQAAWHPYPPYGYGYGYGAPSPLPPMPGASPLQGPRPPPGPPPPAAPTHQAGICTDFKNGVCTRGTACKFAHVPP